MPLGMDVGLSPVGLVLDGPSAPSQKGGRDPKFSVHVYCGQTAAWIKMPFGMEVGLGLHDFVRCGPSYPQKKGTPIPTQFWPMSIAAKWLDA